LYLSNLISKLTGSKFGLLTDGSNSAGGWFSGFLPHRGVFGSSFSGSIGLNTVEMLSNPLSLYFLLGCDFYSEKYPESFVDSLKGSECVISCTPFVNSNIYSYSNLLLPISPSYETSGTFINCLGKWQSFDSVSSSYGHSRPAWKVLRILGNFLKLKDFKYKSSSEVYNELKSSYGYSKVSVGWGSFSSSFLNGFKITDLVNTDRKENILYSSDLLVRNSKVLQDARNLKI
jgi:NADH-quinone oxidoreductase subunit G